MSSIDPTATHTTPVYTWRRYQDQDDSQNRTDRRTGSNDVIDTVELSPEALRILEQSLETTGHKNLDGTVPIPDDKAEAKAKSVEELKEAIRQAMSAKKGVESKINDILKKNGIQVDLKDLDIGVSSDNRIAIAGIDDKELAKKIEKALNEDKDLAREIKDYQLLEGVVSQKISKETDGIYTLFAVKEVLYNPNSERFKQARELWAEEEIDGLQTIDFFKGETELVGMVKEMLQSDGIGLSRDNNWLAEPEREIERLGKEAQSNIEAAIYEHNKGVREHYTDPEEIKEHLWSIANVTITTDATGKVTIEGDLALDAKENSGGKYLGEIYLEAMHKLEKDEFAASMFERASERWVEMHDDEYGDAGQYAHDAAVRIKNGRVDTCISAPEADAKLTEDIQEEVNIMLEDEGVRLDAPLEIYVDDNGRIKATALPNDEQTAEKVEQLLDMLNKNVQVEANKPPAPEGAPEASEKKGLAGAAERIAPMLQHLATHRPDGDRWFSETINQFGV